MKKEFISSNIRERKRGKKHAVDVCITAQQIMWVIRSGSYVTLKHVNVFVMIISMNPDLHNLMQ